MVTKGFKKVIDRLNDGTEDISICGPKGVGKSMALAAIATVCHEKIPCFLWSPSVTFDKDFQEYVEDFYEELHRIEPSKCYSCGTVCFCFLCGPYATMEVSNVAVGGVYPFTGLEYWTGLLD